MRAVLIFQFSVTLVSIGLFGLSANELIHYNLLMWAAELFGLALGAYLDIGVGNNIA